MQVEPLDATFGAVVRDIELVALDDETWPQLPRSLDRARTADLPGPVPHDRSSRTRSRCRFGDLEFKAVADLEHRQERQGPRRARRRRREVTAGQRGLAPRQHLHAGPGEGRGVLGRDRARGRRADWLGRHAGRVRSARRRDACAASTGSPRITRSTTARLERGTCRRRGTTDGGYSQYGYHDKEPSLRPLVKVHPDTGRPNLLHRPPRVRHRRHGPGRIRAAPRRSERVGVPGRRAPTSTTGSWATSSSGTTAA